jgi:hypothetical protein
MDGHSYIYLRGVENRFPHYKLFPGGEAVFRPLSSKNVGIVIAWWREGIKISIGRGGAHDVGVKYGRWMNKCRGYTPTVVSRWSRRGCRADGADAPDVLFCGCREVRK